LAICTKIAVCTKRGSRSSLALILRGALQQSSCKLQMVDRMV
jgi:hypothetical protein